MAGAALPLVSMYETGAGGGVRVVTLRRAPVNAIELMLASAVERAFAVLRDDASCRAVVLTGAPDGGAFSAGVDTRAFATYGPNERAEFLRAINRMVLAIYGLPKPVVAAVSGHAVGGGLVLALACDVRFVARGPVKLGLTEASAGIPFPACPLELVRAELSPYTARTLSLGSQLFAAESPTLVGVVDALIEPGDLLQAAAAEAERRSSMRGYAAVKAQLRAPAVARMRRIVDNDEDPLVRSWL